MTLPEMQSCAAETLTFFIESMPDMPFSADDIVIEFLKRKFMYKRTKMYCEMYCPEKNISPQDLGECRATSVIGRTKSAVIFHLDRKLTAHDLRTITFHELTHIFCAKNEMDGEHFIDVFGTGTMPNLDRTDKYNCTVSIGYNVWSEFIADYYSYKYIHESYDFSQAKPFFFEYLPKIHVENPAGSPQATSLAFASLLASSDAAETLEYFSKPDGIIPDFIPKGKETREVLCACLNVFYTHLLTEKPWKINKDFIYDIGENYLEFLVMNSYYLGIKK